MKGRRNPHRQKLQLDLAHIVICVVIVALAVITFMDMEHRFFLFPVIFALAAALNFINGIIRVNRVHMEDSQFVPGMLLCIAGGALAVLAVFSAYVSYLQLR